MCLYHVSDRCRTSVIHKGKPRRSHAAHTSPAPFRVHVGEEMEDAASSLGSSSFTVTPRLLLEGGGTRGTKGGPTHRAVLGFQSRKRLDSDFVPFYTSEGGDARASEAELHVSGFYLAVISSCSAAASRVPDPSAPTGPDSAVLEFKEFCQAGGKERGHPVSLCKHVSERPEKAEECGEGVSRINRSGSKQKPQLFNCRRNILAA